MINHLRNKIRNTPRRTWIHCGIISTIVLILLIIELVRLFSLPEIKAADLYLHQDPNRESAVVSEIPHGQHVKVIKQSNNWWYIKYNNKRGWIPSWLVGVDGYNVKTSNQLPQTTIVIDPGHGGSDSGTLSANETYMEKTYTLQMAKKVANELRQQHVNVIMTRTRDEYVTLAKRTQLADQSHANLFISFHFNSDNGNGNADGYGVYQYHSSDNKVANTVNKALNNLPVRSRGVSFGNYYVLRENQRPAILCEMGFMDSTHDIQYIKSSDYQQHVADDMSKSLSKYFH